jgi:20S proteasome alpha/beta subunit
LTEDLAPIVRDLGEIVLLVGIGGALYHLDGSGGFSNVGPEFAIGTGAQAAMGALDVLADKLSAETRIRRALTSSSRIRRDVSPPFDIVSVP